MNALEKNILYDGCLTRPAEAQTLRAGPLTMLYAGGDIRYIRLGSREILRRVYAAVRDHNWVTILPRVENEQIRQETDSFRVTFDAIHQQGDIDFFWHGSISGAADGTITFTFDGEARSTFWRNRIGFCVLHPDACAGLPCTVLHTNGESEDTQFPLYISPHQPIFDIRALTHEAAPGVRAEVVMQGDTFEMEDQRNWTDASYKTYCTPLSLPYPATIERGTKVRQSITVRLRSEATLHEGEGFGVRAFQHGLRPSPTHTLTFTNQAVPLPALGLTKQFGALTHNEHQRIKALKLAHLRVELPMHQAVWKTLLKQISRDARTLGLGLEVALFLSDEAKSQLNALRAALNEIRPLVERWLIFHIGEKSTSAKWVRLAREKLGDYGTPIGTGTDYFFTELNRERPPVSEADFVTYSINPQVHAFDNIDLIETLPVQGATVRSARQFSADKPIVISPLTLKMRRNPNATGPQPQPLPGQLPPEVDARQMSLFGAVWTLGSLKALAEAGAHSITYYDMVGWGGVMESRRGTPVPEPFNRVGGCVFPVYHVLADVGEFAGGEALVSQSSNALAFDALVMRKDGQTRVLLANFTRHSQTVILPDVHGVVTIKTLDETNGEDAMRHPEAYRRDAGTQTEAGADGLRVELLPYAVVRVDFAE
jgi:hypothetical protein